MEKMSTLGTCICATEPDTEGKGKNSKYESAKATL